MDIDSKIRELFNKLNERKKSVDELRAHVGKSWKTNCTFRMIGASTTVNLQTAPIGLVEEIATHLCIIEQGRKVATERLHRKLETDVCGYTIQDWFHDIDKRIATINIRDEEKQLELLEQRLSQVLSPEERRRIEVELLAKEIGL